VEIARPRFIPALPPNVSEALKALKQRLQARYGSNLLEVRLFGSYARGEQDDESDVDVLLLFDGESWDDDTLFREVAAVDVAYRVWISPKPMSRELFQGMLERERGFALAVEEEGIAV
jgi:uncharacterized protein